MAGKKRKKFCWVLHIEWDLEYERDNTVQLFTSREKARKELSKQVFNDLKNWKDKFEYFEFKNSKGETIQNLIPLKEESLNTSYAIFYSDGDSDYITYYIYKLEIQ